LAARVKARGVQVLWGRCWEGDGAPAFWPWIQVIRSLLGALDPQQRSNLAVESEIASDVIDQVAQIIPDLRAAHSAPHAPGGDKLEPSEARFLLFDAVTTFFKMAARSHPMLIVLDDLHDADDASLAMLRFMTRSLTGTPISLVATYRDAEVRRSAALTKLIGKLSREARSIPMSGLNESEVTKLVELKAGRTPGNSLVAKLCAATNGNPLFVDGIVRVLMAEGAIESAGTLDHPFRIPSGIREAIRSRLDGLSVETNTILASAAAVGNEFEFGLCQSAADVPADQAHRLLDEASSAGIVTTLGHDRYRFSHALIRGAVYDELDTNGRIRIHGKIANRLEEIYREDVDPHLAELAHHFREAGVAEKAIDYSFRAGRAAASVFAFSDAMLHWQAALDLMERHASDTLQRADLLQALARVAFEVDRAASLRYGESAIALYESLGRIDKAAQIHIQLGNLFHMRDEPLTNVALATHHLRQAELALADGPETIPLAFLYSVISSNESAKSNLVEAARAARRSMEISDHLDNKIIWPFAAAVSAWCLCMEGQLSQGFELFDRAFEVALEAKVGGFPVVGLRVGFLSRWLGDPRGGQLWFEREQKRMRRATSPLSFDALSSWIGQAHFEEGQLPGIERRNGPEDPGFRLWSPGLRFWIDGKWEAVAALMEKLVEAGERMDDQMYTSNHCVFGGFTRLILGEHARAEALFRYGLDNAHPESVVLLEMRARPWLARLYVEMNRLDAALEQVARCRQIMAAGEDWRGLVGNVALAEAIVGAERGNYDSAERQFESAMVIHQKYHLAWDEADTLQYWGRALAAAGDRTRAAEKFDAAIENHRSRGVGPRFLAWLTADKMHSLGRSTGSDFDGAGQSHQPESKVAGTFRREGEFWTISYRDATFRLKDAKGLHYIVYLLARPGQRIHVHDLMEAVEGSLANGRTTILAESQDLQIVREIGGPNATIDARARSEYRARLCDLQAELDEAERNNDLGRSEALRTEIDMVGQELTRSSGLGGRARLASGSAERARVLVGRNIRSVMAKIRGQHAQLGRHFAAVISTGYFCAYQPEPDRPISWQL
jgi:tetratricopeptide (TPR) repeat protein